MAIDFGRRRCGIAVTDTMHIVANSIGTVATAEATAFIKNYTHIEPVERIIVGEPRDLKGNPSESQRFMQPWLQRLAKEVPDIPIELFDERFTSVMAHRAMLDGGLHRMDRRDKATVDAVAASLILNDYLQSRAYADYKNTTQQ